MNVEQNSTEKCSCQTIRETSDSKRSEGRVGLTAIYIFFRFTQKNSVLLYYLT